ncbi:MAG: hypothetical protein N2167_04265 [Flavobacteriales bacterium]|nr:hypothetical protein [Flavobacteriales bacterium]
MHDRDNLLTRIETVEFIVAQRKDGIIHVYAKSDVTINKEKQKLLMELYHEITKGKKQPFIFEKSKKVWMTFNAFRYSVVHDDEYPASLVAIVVNSKIEKILLSLFVKIFFHHKKITRVFESFEKAVAWIHAEKSMQQA